MKHPVSRELFSYWDRLRNGRAAPERTDIDPAALRGVLCDTFILGVERNHDRTMFPVRLAGTRLNAVFMRELKGSSLLDLWPDDDRPAVGRIFETVLDDAAPLVAGLRGGPAGSRAIDLEMVLLPLRHNGRTHARILGTIAPMETPSWLGLLGADQVSLTSLRLIECAVGSSDGERLRVGERPDRLATNTDGPRRYGRFTVHEGGR